MALCFHHVRLAFCVGVLAACGSTSGPDPSTPNGGVAGASNSAGTAGALAGQSASGGAASAAGGGGVAGAGGVAAEAVARVAVVPTPRPVLREPAVL